MDKSYTLKVDKSDIHVLMQGVEKLQILGKDAILVANIYQKLLNITTKISQEE